MFIPRHYNIPKQHFVILRLPHNNSKYTEINLFYISKYTHKTSVSYTYGHASILCSDS